MLANFCLFYRKVLFGFIFIFGQDVVLEQGACAIGFLCFPYCWQILYGLQ